MEVFLKNGELPKQMHDDEMSCQNMKEHEDEEVRG